MGGEEFFDSVMYGVGLLLLFKYLRVEYINMDNSLTFNCYMYCYLLMFCVALGCTFPSAV